MTTTTENNGPADQIRDGAIKATIWANNSEKGTFYSVTLTRTYKNGDGFKETNSFSGAELLKVSRLAGKAYDRIIELKLADRDAAETGGSS